jgi:3-oxoacyl-[acyl-carrier protein] reductase
MSPKNKVKLPSFILAINAGLKIGDEDRMLQPEDVAELILSVLGLPQRVFIKPAGIWTTNPQ